MTQDAKPIKFNSIFFALHVFKNLVIKVLTSIIHSRDALIREIADY